MVIEIGEAREQWGRDIWKMAEDFANNMKKEEKPFYVVYCAKQDKYDERIFRQTIKAYYHRPAPMLGILVWYVDNNQGIFEFIPDLSAPPDVPINPNLLSNDSCDESARVAEQGKRLHALLS
jgi:hypothetical protein